MNKIKTAFFPLAFLCALAFSTYAFAEDSDFYYDEAGKPIFMRVSKAYRALFLAPNKTELGLNALHNAGISLAKPQLLKLPHKGLYLTTKSPPLSFNSEVARLIPVYTFGGKTLAAPTGEILAGVPAAQNCNKLGAEFRLDFKKEIPLGSKKVCVFEIGLQENAFAIARKIYLESKVFFAQPGFVYKVALHNPLNDPLLENQWHLNNTGQFGAKPGNDAAVFKAWETTKGDPSIIIAVIDDGVQTDHPDLKENIVKGYDFLDGDDDPSPLDGSGRDANTTVGHGTACAGVAAARGDNGKGVSGACPLCRIMPLRTIGKNSMGGFISDKDIAQAFGYAIQNGAAILTNSWGFDLGDPHVEGDEPDKIPAPPVIKTAVEYVTESGRGGKGSLVVFSAGNGNTDVALDGIVSLPDVLTVAASADSGLKSYYSNYGKEIKVNAPSNGYGAPWDNSATTGVWTTDRTEKSGYNPGDGSMGDEAGDYMNFFGGTSSAAALAAGIAGLVFSADKSVTARTAMEILKLTADKIDQLNGKYDSNGHSRLYGYGRINAYKAVQKASGVDCVPIEERCDGRDNNCNGLIDEGGVCDNVSGFCERCEIDSECAGIGGRCLKGADGLSYCTHSCESDADCQTPSKCEEDELKFNRCVPPDNQCAKMALADGIDVCSPCLGLDKDCGANGICLLDKYDVEGCAIKCGANKSCPLGSRCFEIAGDDGQKAGDFCFPMNLDCVNPPKTGGLPVCQPCASSYECGETADLCVDFSSSAGIRRGYCGADCSQKRCAEGFDCIKVASGFGDSFFQQCVPAVGSCAPGQTAPDACKADEYCALLVGGRGACVPFEIDMEALPGAPAEIMGKCEEFKPCKQGLCVIVESGYVEGVCLKECKPGATKDETPGIACPELKDCMNKCGEDEKCVQACFDSNFSIECLKCLDDYDECLKANGCFEEGGKFNSDCALMYCKEAYDRCLGDVATEIPFKDCAEGFTCTELPGEATEKLAVCSPPTGWNENGVTLIECSATVPCEEAICVSVGDKGSFCLDRCDISKYLQKRESDGDDNEPPPPLCNCQVRGGGPGWMTNIGGLLFLVAIVIAVARFRKAMKDRKKYFDKKSGKK